MPRKEQLKANRDQASNIPPENTGLTSITSQDGDSLHVAGRTESTQIDDGSLVCGEPVSFPFFLKSMESRHHRLQHAKAQFESPAKVFAMLKSNVQRRVENQGAAFNSPRRGKENIGTIENMKENQRDVCFDEAEALTLSPTSSPKNGLSYTLSDSDCKPLQEKSPMKDIGNYFFKPRNECTPTKRPFLEPTTVPYPLNSVGSDQVMRPPLVRDLDVFKMPNKTPIKGQQLNLSTEAGTGSQFHNACVSLDKHPLMSPAKIFARLKEGEREKKRKRELQELHSISSSAWNLSNGGPTCRLRDSDDVSPPAVKRRQILVEPLPHDSLETSTLKKSYINLARIPPMSPAKMFAHLKERERLRRDAHKVSTSTGDHRNRAHSCPASTIFDRDDILMNADGSPPGRAFPVNRSRSEVADSQSAIGPSEDVLLPDVKARPALVEDPLLIDSPHISLPKKHKAVSKRNTLPTHTQFSNVTEIYLLNWSLCRFNCNGLYVHGIHREENIPWHSNIIEERVSKSVLKSVSGRTYILVGKMNKGVDSDLPKWLLKKFVYGFPQNWKMYYEKFLSESKEQAERKSKGRGATPWPASEKPATKLVVKPHEPKPLTPSACCPPTSSSFLTNDMKVTRSGRRIKPPLEYWKGGRVILDADMNVTIYEGYDVTICDPNVTTPVSKKTSQRPAGVFLPCNEGHGINDESSVQLRKVKTPHRTLNQAKSNPDKKSSNQIERPEEALTSHINSLVERPGTTRRSSPRFQVTKTLTADTIPQPHVEPNQSSKKLNCNRDTGASTMRVLLRKRNSPALTEAPTVNDNASTSWDELSIMKKKGGRGKRVPNKSQPSHLSSSSPSASSSDESERLLRKRTAVSRTSDAVQKSKVREKNKCNKTSPSPKPAPKLIQSGDELSITKKKGGRGKRVPNKSQPSHLSPSSPSASSSDGSEWLPRKRTAVSRTSDAVQKSKVYEKNKCNKTSPHPKPAPKLIQSSKKSNKGNKGVSGNKVVPQEKDEEEWTEAELLRLQEAVTSFPKHMGSYWVNVAMVVGTRSAEECQKQHTSQGSVQVSTKRPKKSKKGETAKESEPPKITARVGTLKRKQQVRQFLDAMPKEDLDDVFSSTSMQSKRFQFELPSMSPSGIERGFKFSVHEPRTPVSADFPSAKTPQCLHITPGMMGSPNRNDNDKYIYQLQKRMKKNQVTAYKHDPSSKYLTPSVKRAMRRCGTMGNDSFVMWEMLPDSDAAESEEEDFYFSDKD